jgi:hypothetical protein
MCRYGFHVYKRHMACFSCRVAVKDRERCPHCGQPLVDMGLDFKAPKKTDIKQWRKLELLHLNDIHFYSCGCGGPGYRPRRLNQVPAFLQAEAEACLPYRSEGEQLLAKFTPRKPERKRTR